MICSPAHHIEISAISDNLEKIDLLLLLEKMAVKPNFEKKHVRLSAEAFYRKGLGPADAVHLAFAAAANASFISCDDKLLKKCSNMELGIWTGNPVAFCNKEDLK